MGEIRYYRFVGGCWRRERREGEGDRDRGNTGLASMQFPSLASNFRKIPSFGLDHVLSFPSGELPSHRPSSRTHFEQLIPRVNQISSSAEIHEASPLSLDTVTSLAGRGWRERMDHEHQILFRRSQKASWFVRGFCWSRKLDMLREGFKPMNVTAEKIRNKFLYCLCIKVGERIDL